MSIPVPYRKLIPAVLVCCGLLFSCSGKDAKRKTFVAESGQAALRISVSALQVNAGDTLRVDYSYTVPEGFSVLPYRLERNHFPGFEIQGRIPTAYSAEEGLLTSAQGLTLRATNAGESEWVLPPLEYEAGGEKKYLTPEKIMVSVSKTSTEADKPKIIEEIKRARLNWATLVPFLVIGVAGFFLILFFNFPRIEKPITDPLVLIGQRLKRLEDAETVSDEHYTELMNIIRFYVEKCLNIPVRGSTTAELLENLRKVREFPAKNIQKVKELADIFELVSFAGLTPDRQNFRDALEKIRAVLNPETAGKNV